MDKNTLWLKYGSRFRPTVHLKERLLPRCECYILVKKSARQLYYQGYVVFPDKQEPELNTVLLTSTYLSVQTVKKKVMELLEANNCLKD